MKSIRNGRVLLPDGNLRAIDISIGGGIIDRLDASLPSGSELDAAGATVLPGIIDLHAHALGTESAGEGNLEEWARIEAANGAAAFFPTCFSSPEGSVEQMRRMLDQTDDLRTVPQVAGFRLESPFLASVAGGAPGSLAPITSANVRLLLDAGRGHLKICDVSPEIDNAVEGIAELTEAGVICSLAHTNCTIDQARAAVDAGLRLVTHMFDTFKLPADAGTGVYPAALVDYLLIEDRVVCEIIGDGTHVHAILVEKAFRCKGCDGLAFVTDSNTGAGLPPGRYKLPGEWGEVYVTTPDNGVRFVDTGWLTGSAMTPISSLRNAIRLFGKDLLSASRVCSTTPARLMGLNKGEIAPGRDADFTIVDENLELVYTMTKGVVTYSAV